MSVVTTDVVRFSENVWMGGHTTPDGTSQCHRYLAGFALSRAKPLVVAVTAVRGDEAKSDMVEQ